MRDLLLGDVDFTSIGFIAFECIKDLQEVGFNQLFVLKNADKSIFLLQQAEKENACMQTSFGASKEVDTSLPPLQLPDFAMEISRNDEEEDESTMETQELPQPRVAANGDVGHLSPPPLKSPALERADSTNKLSAVSLFFSPWAARLL